VFELGEVGDIDGFFGGAGHEQPGAIAFGPLVGTGGKAGDDGETRGGKEGAPGWPAGVKVREGAQNRIVTKAGRSGEVVLLTWNFTPHGIG
jgi:hypothetical protein